MNQSMLLKNKVSKVYHSLLPQSILSIEIPQEKIADCSNCFHCSDKKSRLFNTKCCAYHPVIPNYMIGAILQDNNPLFDEGRKRIAQKISQKVGITPNGIVPPKKHTQRYRKIKGEPQNFSQSYFDKLLCPFYDNGGCSIWAYRTELCSTYFCISVGGKYGEEFWDKFGRYLMQVEFKLSLLALQKIGFPLTKIISKATTLKNLNLENLESELNVAVYKKLWDDWSGKEIELFMDCYNAIQTLGTQEIQECLGIEEEILEHQILELAYKFRQKVVPEHLTFNKDFQFKESQNGDYHFTVGKDGNYVSLRSIQFKMLQLFNGKNATPDLVRKATLLDCDFSSKIPDLITAKVLLPS